MDRRTFLKRVVVAGSGGALAASGMVTLPSAVAFAQSNPRYAGAVDAGLRHFQRRAADQLPLAERLVGAIESGNMEVAQTAYLAARPPYEEIEVLAGSFEATDSDIDARPYSFEAGETSDDFRGFHRIEALLYRDEGLEAALPYAERLVESVRTLQSDLDTRPNFSAQSHFSGMVALATEIASKKISSEEETYSDQSLIIFRHNFRGIYSQFEPFAAELDDAAAGAVREAYEAAEGVLEPLFTGAAATPYSQVGMSTRGDIVQASYRLRDTLLRAAERLGLEAAHTRKGSLL